MTGSTPDPRAPGPRYGVPGVFVSGPAVVRVLLLCLGLSAAACSPSSDSGGASPAASGPPDPGEQVYARACVACHGAGLVGAPRLGDGPAWAPRIAKGRDVLIENALNGFSGQSGVMPPKGGHAYLDEAAVSAAVDYMVQAAE